MKTTQGKHEHASIELPCVDHEQDFMESGPLSTIINEFDPSD